MIHHGLNPATTPVTSMLTFMQHRDPIDEAEEAEDDML